MKVSTFIVRGDVPTTLLLGGQPVTRLWGEIPSVRGGGAVTPPMGAVEQPPPPRYPIAAKARRMDMVRRFDGVGWWVRWAVPTLPGFKLCRSKRYEIFFGQCGHVQTF